MTFAYWCVLIAALLPLIATLAAKSRRDFDNANPRAWLAKQEGFRARAHAAQLNSFEAFPLFAAAVIIAHQRGAPQNTIDLLALIYIGARILFLAFYLANLPAWRSAAWFVALASAITMFFVGS